MSSFDSHAPAAAGLFPALDGFLETLKRKLEVRRKYHRTRDELMSLNGRELADLGINPAMINSIAWEAANES